MIWNLLMRLACAMQNTGVRWIQGNSFDRAWGIKLMNAGQDLGQWAMASKWPDTFLGRQYWEKHAKEEES